MRMGIDGCEGDFFGRLLGGLDGRLGSSAEFAIDSDVGVLVEAGIALHALFG